jgi:hypothetical protein
MKKLIGAALAAVLLTTALSGCIVLPGPERGHHHHRYY